MVNVFVILCSSSILQGLEYVDFTVMDLLMLLLETGYFCCWSKSFIRLRVKLDDRIYNIDRSCDSACVVEADTCTSLCASQIEKKK